MSRIITADQIHTFLRSGYANPHGLAATFIDQEQLGAPEDEGPLSYLLNQMTFADADAVEIDEAGCVVTMVCTGVQAGKGYC